MAPIPAPPPHAGRKVVVLPAGRLTLDVARSVAPLDQLCAFATRRNPRRAFLIVSKLLGRHIPTRPSVMRGAMRDLAAMIPADLPDPILVVGLAETAICLGQGVHEELARRGRCADFVHSTRQTIDCPLLCRFQEPHSHAAGHLLYRPDRIDLAATRSLLLVDDEVSTGATLVNLAEALVAAIPSIRNIAVATLTDWSGPSGWLKRMPRPARCFSLLSGTLGWEPGPAPAPDAIPEGGTAFGTMAGRHDAGRRGWTGALPMPLPDPAPFLAAGEAALSVVGTGEFTYPPFLFAERLERAGRDVVVQATTRSPVLVGGPIANALSFRDNYGASVPNFLYNAGPGSGRRSIVCHETPPGSVDPDLVEALGAATLFFEGEPPCAP
jgi:hypothetical protein